LGERLLLHGRRDDDGREGELVALDLIPKEDIADPNAAAVEDLVWAVVDLFKILCQRKGQVPTRALLPALPLNSRATTALRAVALPP
jgi:hypothetical protein